MSDEQWKDVVGLENCYEVSSLGRIRSKERNVKITKSNGSSYNRPMKSKILKDKTNNRGYHQIVLKDLNGNRYDKMIHRMVAEAFIVNPDPENKTTVNHIDGNKDNNTITNLEWATYSEQNQHAYDTGLRDKTKLMKPLSEETKQKMKESSARKGKPALNRKRLMQIDPVSNEVIKIWDCAKDAAEFFNCHYSTLTDVANKKKSKNGSTRILGKGFKWEWEPTEDQEN